MHCYAPRAVQQHVTIEPLCVTCRATDPGTSFVSAYLASAWSQAAMWACRCTAFASSRFFASSRSALSSAIRLFRTTASCKALDPFEMHAEIAGFKLGQSVLAMLRCTRSSHTCFICIRTDHMIFASMAVRRYSMLDTRGLPCMDDTAHCIPYSLCTALNQMTTPQLGNASCQTAELATHTSPVQKPSQHSKMHLKKYMICQDGTMCCFAVCKRSIVATIDTSQNIPVTLYCMCPEGEHQNA